MASDDRAGVPNPDVLARARREYEFCEAVRLAKAAGVPTPDPAAFFSKPTEPWYLAWLRSLGIQRALR